MTDFLFNYILITLKLSYRKPKRWNSTRIVKILDIGSFIEIDKNVNMYFFVWYLKENKYLD